MLEGGHCMVRVMLASHCLEWAIHHHTHLVATRFTLLGVNVVLAVLASWLPMETRNKKQRVCIQTLISPQNLNSWLTAVRTNWCHNVANNYSKELHCDHIAKCVCVWCKNGGSCVCVCMMQKWWQLCVCVCVCACVHARVCSTWLWPVPLWRSERGEHGYMNVWMCVCMHTHIHTLCITPVTIGLGLVWVQQTADHGNRTQKTRVYIHTNLVGTLTTHSWPMTTI